MMKSKNILVVDDEEDIRQLFTDLLSVRGHRVRCAGDGIDCGVEILKDRPDVILMDLKMPNMNGPKSVKYLKDGASKENKDIKIIIITGDMDLESMEVLEKYRVPYLLKPINFPELYKLIEED